MVELLSHVARGALANPTLSAVDLGAFVHDTLTQGMDAEDAQRKRVREAGGAAGRTEEQRARERSARSEAKRGVAMEARAVPGARAEARAQEKEREDKKGQGEGVDRAVSLAMGTHGHVFVEMALGMLSHGVRKGPLSARDASTLGLLDPLLRPVVRCLRSRHEGSVLAAMRCLEMLARLPLPSLGEVAEEAGAALTEVLKGQAKSTGAVAQEGIRLVTVLLRECEAYRPSTQQMRFLLKWAFAEMEEHTERGTLLSLLRAMIARQVRCPSPVLASSSLSILWFSCLSFSSYSPFSPLSPFSSFSSFSSFTPPSPSSAFVPASLYVPRHVSSPTPLILHRLRTPSHPIFPSSRRRLSSQRSTMSSTESRSS